MEWGKGRIFSIHSQNQIENGTFFGNSLPTNFVFDVKSFEFPLQHSSWKYEYGASCMDGGMGDLLRALLR